MLNFSEIQKIHIEITDICNAACPMCSRHTNGGRSLNPLISNTFMSHDNFRLIFNDDLCNKLTHVSFSGVFGDPCTSPFLLEQLAFLKQKNIGFVVSTNGGMQSKTWWSELAKLCDNKNQRVDFSIDGLEDTNHIYRRQVNWSKLSQNFTNFISSGGYAYWQFISFKHNQHQIEEVKKYAIRSGFKAVKIKNTNRFTHRHGATFTEQYGWQFPVRNLNDDEILYNLEPDASFIENKINSNLDAPIYCQAIDKNEIFISANGQVYPCCFLYSSTDTKFLTLLEKNGGRESLTITRDNSIQKIVKSDLFNSISKSWSQSQKLDQCLHICGIKNKVQVDLQTF